MRLPRGFGKNYFRLTAITATVNQISLNANSSRVQTFHMLNFKSDELEAIEEEDEQAAAICTLELSLKPCHCNCHFLKRTRKTLKTYHSQNLFYNYYKTLNNAISPPLKKIATLLAEARNDNDCHCEHCSVIANVVKQSKNMIIKNNNYGK